jgi:hypothetical protein
MDRDDLMALIAEMNGRTLKVDVEGMIYDDDDNIYTPNGVLDAVEQLNSDLVRMLEVVAWAKKAPLYAGREPADPTNTGTAVDRNGNPY